VEPQDILEEKMILTNCMHWFFHRRRWPQFSLYRVAPREVMLAARQKMLRDLARRFKDELRHSNVLPKNK
jgi:hypothetical protein